MKVKELVQTLLKCNQEVEVMASEKYTGISYYPFGVFHEKDSNLATIILMLEEPTIRNEGR